MSPLTIVAAVVLLAAVAHGDSEEYKEIGFGEKLQNAIHKAKASIERALERTEHYRFTRRYVKKSARDLLSNLRTAKSKQAKVVSKAAEVFEEAIRLLYKEGKSFCDLTEAEEKEVLILAGCIEGVTEVDHCSTAFNKKYRQIDGTCNNRKRPMQGASFTPFRRLAPAEYENDVNTPKGWTPHELYHGVLLPSARTVSVNLLSSETNLYHPYYSHMVFQFGQFLDHDLTFSPQVANTVDLNEGLPCSENCQNEFPCFPIQRAPNDPRIQPGECIGSTRTSAICIIKDRSDDYQKHYIREQVNGLTAAIDGSNVYGSTQEELDKLRDPVNREYLRTGHQHGDKLPLLPFEEKGNETECSQPEDGEFIPCFVAGDERANEQPGLTAMHTIFMREHNRVAKKLIELKPKWSADRVFLEAKKIVGAELQVIVYNGWLPKVVGPDIIDSMGEGKYRKNVNLGISNEFATAAFRLHSTILPLLFLLDEHYQEVEGGHIPLHKTFSAPFIFKRAGMDNIIRGTLGTRGRRSRPEFAITAEVTERLFARLETLALDLAALNIQRGRDHGLPSYNTMRERCNLGKATRFGDLSGDIPTEQIRRLARIYKNVNNIDLFAGGVVENHLPGSILGPTFSCIVREQFVNLRDGDRFFYKWKKSFTKAKRKELEKTSLSRIICDNTDSIDRVPRDAFLTQNYEDMIPCEDLPEVDLSEW